VQGGINSKDRNDYRMGRRRGQNGNLGQISDRDKFIRVCVKM
jgi:hypothetical protein